jgi:hypothetical protein
VAVATFHIYRSRHNGHHFVAVLDGDQSENAVGVRNSRNLVYETRIDDDGKPHLGFDPQAARAAIRDRGFHAFAVTIESRDHFE